MTKSNLPAVFLSYQRQSSKDLARYIHDYLVDELGLDVFFDVEDVNGGRFETIIKDAILKSSHFIVILTPTTLDSEWVRREIVFAIDNETGKTIIPIIADGFSFYQPIPPEVEDIQHFGAIDFDYKSPNDFFRRLRRGLGLEVDIIESSSQPEAPEDTQSEAIDEITSNEEAVPPISRSQTEKEKKRARRTSPKKRWWNNPKVALAIAIIGLLLASLQVAFGSITDLIDRIYPDPPPPSLAYLFVVDTSSEMAVDVNGISRQEIAIDAIRQIAEAPLNTSQVWRGLRVMGGGDLCNQSELIANGRNISSSEFMSEFESSYPQGVNAYELGIRESFEDFTIRDAAISDIKVVFIILGSLELDPCRDFNFGVALSSYKQVGISTTFCTFTLAEDNIAFEAFQQQMAMNGFGCVHNVENPEEISKIAIRVMEGLILNEIGENEVDIEALHTPTPIVYLRPTDTSEPTVTPNFTETESSQQTMIAAHWSPTPSATYTSTEKPTDTPTLTSIPPTETETPHLTQTYVVGLTSTAAGWTVTPSPTDSPEPTSTLTATNTPTDTATPTYTATNTPTDTPTPSNTPTDTPTPTRTPRPTRTPTTTPTNVPQESILYSEDFEDGEAQNWDTYYATWTIEEDDASKFWRGTGPTNYPQAWLDLEKLGISSSNWDNYAIELNIRFQNDEANTGFFTCVRTDGGSQFYSAVITTQWSHVARYYNGEYQVLREGTTTLTQGRWYTLRVEVEGTEIRFYVDNRIAISAEDSSLSSGSIGFYMGGGDIVDIDNIRVWSLE